MSRIQNAVSLICSGVSPDVVARRLSEGGSVVDNLAALNRWWKTKVGSAVIDAVREMTTAKHAEDEEKEQQALSQIEHVYIKGVLRRPIEEADNYPVAVHRYNRAMVVVARHGLFPKLAGVDIEKDLGLVYLWFDADAAAEDLANAVRSLKTEFGGTKLVSRPEDVEEEMDEDGFFFVIVSKEQLPEFPFEEEPEEEEKDHPELTGVVKSPGEEKPEPEEGPPEGPGAAKEEEGGEDVPVEGEVEVT